MVTMLDFNFVGSSGNSKIASTSRKSVPVGRGSKVATSRPASETPSLTANEGERFLQIIAQSARIKRHYDLFQLLQSSEIQSFIPHQALISAWGDFSEPNLKVDVVSDIPGVRTAALSRCAIDGMLKDFYKRWLAHGRQPLVLDSTMGISLSESSCGCDLHASLQDKWSVLVHGVTDVRDGSDCLYLAFNDASILNGRSIERFRLLADSLITQIDVAFRKIPALTIPVLADGNAPSASLRVLTEREEQILQWISEGRTNAEIALIVGISSFTVKNHAQRIFRKLGVTNRIEAVAKFSQMSVQPA
jgi:transcriptional regulator EpsA